MGRKGTDNLHKRRRYYVAKAIQESSMWPRQTMRWDETRFARLWCRPIRPNSSHRLMVPELGARNFW